MAIFRFLFLTYCNIYLYLAHQGTPSLYKKKLKSVSLHFASLSDGTLLLVQARRLVFISFSTVVYTNLKKDDNNNNKPLFFKNTKFILKELNSTFL